MGKEGSMKGIRKKRPQGIFLKDGKFQIYVPGRVGRKQKSTGTGNAMLARNQKRLVAALKDQQDWQLLDAVVSGRFSLTRLYAAHVANTLDELRGELDSVDLSQQIDGWGDWVRAAGGTTLTAATYRAQVMTLITPGFRAHELTRPKISEWLTGIRDITTGTRRKYLYALHSFVGFLLERGLLEVDPTAGIKSPKKNKPRLRWVEEVEDIRIVEAAPAEYRALFALIKSTGAEVSAALATLRTDVDLSDGLVHIRGTKNEKRDRHDAIIETWALPYLKDHCRAIVGATALWPHVTRYKAHAVHQATCKALGIEDYTLRDARHSWAVRSRKRGESLEAIASQLGHSSVYMAATVYGRFKPTIEERKERKEAAF
jgi:integrase